MTTPAASLYPTPTAPAKPAALWEDFVDIFTQPAAVFERRRDGRFWAALIAFTVVSTLALFAARPVIQPALDRQMSAQIAKITADPNIPAERREAAATQIRGMADSPWALAAGAVFLPFMLFLVALTLWLVAKPFGSGASLGQAMAVTAIAGIPRAVLGLVVAGVSAVMGRQVEQMQAITLGPAAFLGADASPVTAALLGRFDLGVLWHTVLLGVGIALMGRLVRRADAPPAVEGTIPRRDGLLAAAIVWALGSLMAVVQAFNQAA